MYQRIDKDQVQKIREEVTEALDKIAKKYGQEAKVGRITYGRGLSAKVEFNPVSQNEHGKLVMTKEAVEFTKICQCLGINKDILGEKLNYLGDTIIVKGYNTRAKKYPICYTKNDQDYKCSHDFLKKIVQENYPEWAL